MDRRRFLQALGISAATLAVDPEALLWTPGKTATFDLGSGLAHAPGGNQLLTVEMITREALRMLEDNLTFAGKIHRQYDSKFRGGTVNIRVPVRYQQKIGSELYLAT